MENFGSHVYFLILGINEYADNNLQNLLSPESDSLKLYNSITDTSPFAIPKSNAQCLTISHTGKAITKSLIVTSIKATIDQLGTDDYIYIYFAGHGERDEQNFYLCGQDAQLSNLPETALSSAEIELLFEDVKAKGIFFIIDCCKGAGFTEMAPKIFKNNSSSGFRILLSAAGKDENSWELPNGKGTLFTNSLLEAINRKSKAGDEPFLFLSQFSEIILSRMDEEYEKNPGAKRQTPAITASYSRDPLLFAGAGISNYEVNQKIKRYSREFLLNRIRRAVALIAILIAFSLGCYYSFIEQHQYAIIDENGRIEIYQGYPGYNAFGFPHLYWQPALSTSLFKENSSFIHNRIIISDLGEPVFRKLKNELSMTGVQVVADQNGTQKLKKEEIRTFILNSLNSQKPIREITGNIQVYESIADSSDNPLFVKLAGYNDPYINEPVARFLVREFDKNYPIIKSLKGNEFNSINFTILKGILSHQQKTKSLEIYLNKLCLNDSSYLDHSGEIVDYILTTAIVFKKSLPTIDIIALLDNCRSPEENIGDIMDYSMLTGKDDSVGTYLTGRLKKLNVADFQNWAKINHSLLALSFTNGQCIPDYKRYYQFNAQYFAPFAAAALTKFCPDYKIAIDNAYVAPWLAKANHLEPAVLLDRITHPDPRAGSDQIIPLIKSCFYIHNGAIVNYLKALPDKDSYISGLKIAVLDSLRIKTPLNEALLQSGSTEIASNSLSLLYHQDKRKAFSKLVGNLDRFSIEEEKIADLFQSFDLTEADCKLLNEKLNKDNTEKVRAAIIIAVAGNERDAINMISNKEIGIRDVAVKYVLLNKNFSKIARNYIPDPSIPDFVPVGLRNYSAMLSRFRKQVTSVPLKYRPLLIKLLQSIYYSEHEIPLLIRKAA